ncbi:MAG: hypothetical protein VB095_00450 [Anaerovorax sp.]|nr:hypothetical protein [Anaerovorax sp.]
MKSETKDMFNNVKLTYNNVLFLTSGDKWDVDMIGDRGIDVCPIYKKQNKLGRIIRRLHSRINLINKDIWYDTWKKNLNGYECIIVFDAIIDFQVISYIRNNTNRNCRLIFYFRNIIDSNKRNWLKYLFENDYEIWSFDEKDCHKYNLKYNPEYFFEDSINKIEGKSRLKNDIIFIGIDKGRLQKLLELRNIFNDKNLKSYFYILQDKLKYNIEEKKELKKKIMPYKDVLRLTNESKAILELLSGTQEGLTLRSLEAIFLKKKLITDNQKIINYPFYSKENVFILGRDSIDKIQSFINSDYKELDYKILNYYTFEEWFNRLFRR